MDHLSLTVPFPCPYTHFAFSNNGWLRTGPLDDAQGDDLRVGSADLQGTTQEE
jgi:hypothetical protein